LTAGDLRSLHRKSDRGRPRQAISRHQLRQKKPGEEAKAPVQPGFWLSMPNKGAFAAAIGIYLPRQTD
jgi:hypothetical protein